MRLLFWQLAATCVVVTWADLALAQRRPVADDTLGSERSIVTPEENLRGLAGDRIRGGARRGANLFHSFREFGIDPNRAVYFDDPGVQNIFSRVTGGNASEIFGRLGVLGNANLFLLNPSGIVFGPNASLDVRGAFVGTTADSFVFDNGFAFSATNPQAPPLLTVSTPIGLQYGVQTPGAITVNQARLFVDSGQSLILAGGEITVDNGGLFVDFPQGGRIELGAIAGAGTVGLEQNGSILSLSLPETLARADVQIINDSLIDVVAENGGSVAINARNLNILGESSIQAGIRQRRGTANSQAGDIVLDATEEIQVGQLSRITNNIEANGIGNSGDIYITAGSLYIIEGAQLSASTFGQGDAGNVIINADNQVVFDGSSADGALLSGAFSRVEEGGIGRGGNVNIDTDSLIVRNGAQLAASTAGQGNAGNVEIDANSLEVLNGAQLQASTFKRGDAGNVIIHADDRVVFDNGVALSTVEEAGVGNGRNVEIDTNSLEVRNGGQLQASTRGQGDAGSVIIYATDRVLFDGTSADGNFASAAFSRVGEAGVGRGGSINIDTNSLIIRNGAQLAASNAGQGNAGNIEIDANSLEVLNGAQLQAFTREQGDAGNVIIHANDQVIFDGTSIAFSTVEAGGIGNGGDINITAGSLFVTNGAQLQASTLGRGDAGSVIIHAGNRVVFDGTNDDGFSSAAFSRVGEAGVGRGGNINITAGSLFVTNGAQLTTSTSGRGDAGSVIIHAGNRVVFDGTSAGGLPSLVLSRVEAGGIGNGGDINITAGSLFVTNGAQLQASTLGRGDAGGVVIHAGNRVVFDHSNAFSAVGAANLNNVAVGEGGNIKIDTNSLEVLNGAQLQTSTYGRGNAGSIIIYADGRVVFDGTGTDGSFSAALSTVESIGYDDMAERAGGNVEIDTNSLEVRNGAALTTSTFGRGDAGNVIIDANDQVVFDNSAAISRAEESSIGRGGNIRIDTNSLVIRNGAALTASTFGQGDAGNVLISATDQVVLDDGGIFSRVETSGRGDGGNVDIDTNSLVVRNGAALTASTRGQGRAGRVIIDTETVSIEGVGNDGRSSGLFTSTFTGATRRGGNVRINANSVRVADGAVINAETETALRGGDVAINADNLEVTGGGQVITTTSGSGRAGNITLNVAERIVLSGFDPNYAGRRSDFGNRVGNEGAASGLFANTADNSSGQGGTIRIRTGDLDVSDRARVVANSQGDGVAGNIRIRTNSLELTNDGRLLADTRGEGNAGNVIINADTFEATDGGRVITTTASGGQAGNITLNVSDRITLSDAGRRGTSGLFANTRPDSSGRGGRIRITTGELDVLDRARVVVNSQGDGVAGNMDITAQSVQLDRGRLTAETGRGRGGNITLQGLDQLQLRNDSLISATTQGSDLAGNIGISAQSVQLDQGSLTTRSVGGDGGNITLQDLDQLQLRNDSLISATAGTEQAGGGNGGNITIDADFIVAFPGEDSDIEANAFEGSGGNVEITTEGLLGIEARETATNFNDITASSEQGVQGTVTIDQPDADPSQGLTELPVSVVDASDQIAQTCPTDGDIAEEVGEFVVTGRGGLPANPAEMLGGETVLTELAEAGDKAGEAQGDREAREPNRVSAAINPEAEIMEAQGWVVGADGKVMLTAENPAVQPHSPATAPVLCPSS